jgi:FkbM family methyltransferase
MSVRQRVARAIRRAAWPALRRLRRDNLTLRRIEPRSDLEKIGSDYGGWVVPTGLLDAGSVCYCAGCGEDISFDLGLVRRFGCEIFAFDPTPRAVLHVGQQAKGVARYHFTALGLWDGDDVLRFFAPKDPAHVSHSALNLQQTDDYFEARVSRLSSLMRERGHERLDLLKLDIEGAEYRVVDSMLEDELEVGILCVEFDEYYNPLDSAYAARIRDSVARILDTGYALVHSEGNGNYTFVRRPRGAG